MNTDTEQFSPELALKALEDNEWNGISSNVCFHCQGLSPALVDKGLPEHMLGHNAGCFLATAIMHLGGGVKWVGSSMSASNPSQTELDVGGCANAANESDGKPSAPADSQDEVISPKLTAPVTEEPNAEITVGEFLQENGVQQKTQGFSVDKSAAQVASQVSGFLDAAKTNPHVSGFFDAAKANPHVQEGLGRLSGLLKGKGKPAQSKENNTQQSQESVDEKHSS